MPGLDRLIEPVRKFSLARERAVPLAGDAPELPEGQLQVDQRQRGVGPGVGLCQVLKAQHLYAAPLKRSAPADDIKNFLHQSGRHIIGSAQLLTESQ